MSNPNQSNPNQKPGGQKPDQQNDQKRVDVASVSTNAVTDGFQAIATAYGDYSKKSFEDTKSFVERLSGAKSIDKAIEIQTDFAKASYETFVAESQKIAALYGDLAKQSYKPFSNFIARTPSN